MDQDLDPVSAVLTWLEKFAANTPLASAIAADLGPVVVGWAVSEIVRESAAEALPRTTRPTKLLRRIGGAYSARNVRRARAIPTSTPAELLAVCLQSNSTRAFLPVAAELAAMGVRTRFLLDPTDGRSIKLMKEAGQAYDVIIEADGLSSVTHVARLLANLKHLWSKPSLRELCLALRLKPNPERLAALRSTMRYPAVSGALIGEALWRALSAHQTSGVLFVTKRALFNRLLPVACPSAKRIFFLQGVVPDIPPIRTDLDVDLAIAGSPIDLPYLTRCKVPAERVALTGYPDYDHFHTLEKSACRAQYERATGIDGQRPWILFTSQYPTHVFGPAEREKNIATVIQAAAALPTLQFIVKLHPNKEKWTARALPPNVIVEKSYDTPTLIKAADVMVTYWSTTALEALLLETPLIQLNATSLPDFLTFPAALRVPFARDATQLAELIRERLSHRNDEDVLHHLGIAMDGRAARHAAESIRTLLKGS